jgi:beta-lactamase regulating signal transducer with metallopeptidase domain
VSTLVAIGAGAKAWLGTVGMMAVTGTVLALIALVVTRAARRVRPAWQAAIWLVVVAKFAIPWGPAMPWSLSDLFALLAPHGAPEPAFTGPPALQPLPPAPHAWPAIGWILLAFAWAAIAMTIIVRAVLAARRTYRAARAAEAAPDHARALLAECAVRVGARRAPALVVGDGASGPYLVGIVRPIIVVPPVLLEDAQLLRAALLHELAHVRRRDAIGRMLQVWATAVAWFAWPVVRRVGKRLDLARESACDAWALEAGDIARPAYARLLVRMAELRSAAGAAHLAAPHALDKRVAAVLGPPARARIGVVQAVALVAWIAVALGGARTASARGEHPVCTYTPQLGLSLFQSYPEADLDGDGTLSREEACELQAQLRRHVDELASHLDPEAEVELETLLSEPLCCNCDQAEANSSAEGASCQTAEGVSP